MKKSKKKRIRGFTLVEVLGVIVILSILVAIVVPTVSEYMARSKDSYNKSLEKEFVLAGKNYFSMNTKELPRRNSYSTFVTLGELESNGLITGNFVDADKGKCKDISYVRVKREYKTNEYKYYACLDCENYKSDNGMCDVNELLKTDNTVTCSIDVKNDMLEGGFSKNNSFDVGLKVKSHLDIKRLYYVDDAGKEVVINRRGSYFSVDATSIIKVNSNTSELRIFVEDYNGGFTTGEGCSVELKYDDVNPVCNISKNPSDAWSKTNVTVTGNCEDTNGSGCAVENVVKLVSSSFTGKIGQVCDKVGNCTDCNTTVNIDKKSPTCEIKKNPSDAWSKTDVTVTRTCKDEGESGCVSKPVEKLFSSSGTYDMGQVCDKAGNCTSCGATVNIDKTAPTCTVSKNPSSTWSNTDVTVIGTCKDVGESGCVNTTVSKKVSSSGTYSPGSVKDNAGLSTTCGNISVNIDKTAPTVKLTNSSGGSWTKDSVTVSATASDSDSGIDKIYYSTDNSNWYELSSTTTGSKTWDNSTNRNFTLYVKAKDKAGNYSSVATTSVKIDIVLPYISKHCFYEKIWEDNKYKWIYRYYMSDDDSGLYQFRWGYCYNVSNLSNDSLKCSTKAVNQRYSGWETVYSVGTSVAYRSTRYQISPKTGQNMQVATIFQVKDVAGNLYTSPVMYDTWNLGNTVSPAKCS